MAYSTSLEIPANTASTSPSSVDIEFSPMLVDRIEITFPSGCVGLVGVRFRYQDRVIWPYNRTDWFKGNGQTIIFTPNLELNEPPYVLTVEGYNDDDTYPHTIYTIIDVEFKGGLLDIWKTIFFGGGRR